MTASKHELFSSFQVVNLSRFALVNLDRFQVVSLNRSEVVKFTGFCTILRFADELADDKTRASHTLLNNNSLSNNPSEIFHAYSACVDSVITNHRENVILS